MTGTLKYNKGITAFPDGEQEGHYFPLMLDSEYQGKEITVKRDGAQRKQAVDLEWVLYVPNTGTVFTFETVEDGVILTLSFKGATFAEADG